MYPCLALRSLYRVLVVVCASLASSIRKGEKTAKGGFFIVQFALANNRLTAVVTT
jgi:hypothetical protein